MLKTLIYIPIYDNGWDVRVIPSEQLVYLGSGKCLRKLQGKYVKGECYKLEYLFKSSESAWRFIRGEIVTLDDIYIEDEIWPNNRINPLNKRKRFTEEGKGQKYIARTKAERTKIEKYYNKYYKRKGREKQNGEN